MANKFYEVHYAVMEGIEVKDLGILNYQTGKSASREELVVFAKQQLGMPNATIRISHVSKLSREEYEAKLPGIPLTT